MTDRPTLPRDKVVELCDALGHDPDHVAELRITPREVQVIYIHAVRPDRTQVQANDRGDALTIGLEDARLTASSTGRMMGGQLVRYGVYGRTSQGRLRVRPGALRFHDDLARTILTREHDRGHSRGVLAAVHDGPEAMRVQLRAADGADGDAALQEARDGSRAGLSFDVVDAQIVGDEITDALVIAIGQVGIPAYDDGRIDQIAASLIDEGNTSMTEEQRARLRELMERNQRTTEEEQEYQTLQAQAVAEAVAPPAEPEGNGEGEGSGEGTEVAASNTDTGAGTVRAAVRPAVPGGAPSPREGTRTEERTEGAFAAFTRQLARAMQPGNPTRLADVTAALADVTHSAHSETTSQPAWSGELWSGLVYEPQWSDLFNSGPLTNMRGQGWRFTSKLEIQDYAGDKAEIPTDNVTTEDASYLAARMAVGVDIDRAFFDFPNEGFVESLFGQVRESWEIKLDAKIRAYVLANADAARTNEKAPVSAENPVIAGQSNLLKAAAVAIRALKRRRVGVATWLYVNDDDLFTLFEMGQFDVPAYLDLFGIDPRNFRSSEDVPAGNVVAGVKPAATVRTLPGSPVRVEAQNLTRAGVDDAFFGYYAIEEHHTRGIASAAFTPPV